MLFGERTRYYLECSHTDELNHMHLDYDCISTKLCAKSPKEKSKPKIVMNLRNFMDNKTK